MTWVLLIAGLLMVGNATKRPEHVSGLVLVGLSVALWVFERLTEAQLLGGAS